MPELERVLGDGSSVLDGFAGSGVVSYSLASLGCEVTATDRLLSAVWGVRGFIEFGTVLSDEVADRVVAAASSFSGGDLSDSYQGVFYPDDETIWLEGAAAEIRRLPETERGVAFWALFQAALAKRPYNLFHRANLDMRTRDVPRTFGNKKTWETPFDVHFRKFVAEANKFVLTDGTGHGQQADPSSIDGHFDLAYFDPPYMNGRGVRTPYDDYYGFLDLLVDESLLADVDESRPHLPLRRHLNPWDKQSEILGAFAALFERHVSSAICVSYRSDGLPSIEQIRSLLSSFKGTVEIHTTPISYALSKGSGHEVLIVGR
jgi:adenine-specific DNA-methyltransferase